jgi:hypothetical protein
MDYVPSGSCEKIHSARDVALFLIHEMVESDAAIARMHHDLADSI